MPVAVLSLLLSSLVIAAEAPGPQNLLVSVRVLQSPAEDIMGNAAGTRVVAEPTIMITAGRTGSIHVGTEIALPESAVASPTDTGNSNPILAVGTQVEIRAGHPREGKVQLDLSFDYSERIPASDDRIDIRRSGVRTIGQFEFGKPIRVASLKTSERGSTWMEVTVEPVSE